MPNMTTAVEADIDKLGRGDLRRKEETNRRDVKKMQEFSLNKHTDKKEAVQTGTVTGRVQDMLVKVTQKIKKDEFRL